MPRSASQASNGPATAPAALWMNCSRAARSSSRVDGAPADHVAVAVEVFRGRVIDDVRAQLERPLEIGRRERVVDDEQRAAVMRDLRHRRDVGETHQRIGRRLDEHESRFGSHRVGDALRIARVDVCKRQREVLEDLVEQPEGAAVHVLGADDVIACLEQLHDRVEAAHAARERESVSAVLQRGDVPLERLARGVLSAGVLVALVLTQPLLDVGRRQVHRSHDGPGEGLGALSGVDRAGAKAWREVVIKDACHADTLSCAMRRS